MRRAPYLLLGLLWTCGVCAGWAALGWHSAEAGQPATPPPAVASTDGPHLMLFAHPRCPCTPASLRTLAQMLRTRPDVTPITVYMMVPENADADWQDTPVWHLAHQLSGAAVVLDPGGKIARQYNVHTSGQVVFYDADGVLRFVGGLTPSRGHEGKTSGQDALMRVLDALPAALTPAPVYGCSLHDAPPSG